MPELTLAWARALAGPSVARRHLDRHHRSGRRIRPLATGDDVAALGVPPGPEIGAILKELRAAQADGHVRSRTGALRWLQGTVARSRGRGEAALTVPAVAIGGAGITADLEQAHLGLAAVRVAQTGHGRRTGLGHHGRVVADADQTIAARRGDDREGGEGNDDEVGEQRAG